MTTAHKAAPKVFISYSWSGPEHEKFVEDLATSLRNSGVDAIFDKWRLKPGQDKNAFMESMVTDPGVVKVLVICDRKYKEKADVRTGGVGAESQIISSETYTKVGQTKFIPVIAERDENGQAFVPVFMKSLLYVDISSEENWGAGFDELLRLIYDKPLSPEPQLGEVPAFLKPESTGVPMARELPGTLRAIRDGKSNRDGLENLFVRSVLHEVRQCYVTPKGEIGYDEEIYQAILRTKGLRDQFSDYIDAVATFSGDEPRGLKHCIHLAEQLGQLFGPPVEGGTFVDGWTDLYRFFALEVALIVTAALIRNERWQMLRYWLKNPFLLRTDHSGVRTENIVAFSSYLPSIDEHRNARLGLNRTCLSADMLKERSSTEHTPFGEIVQADMFLALFGAAKLSEQIGTGFYRFWMPRTAVYSSHSQRLPIFLKAVDPDFRNNILLALSVQSGANLAEKLDDARTKTDNFRNLLVGRLYGFDFEEAVNLKTLTT